MKIRTLLALPILLGAIAVPPASADHCNGEVTEVAGFYIDDRGGDEVWVYQESNGIEGLQSGGDNGLWEDDCSHETPDTLIF